MSSGDGWKSTPLRIALAEHWYPIDLATFAGKMRLAFEVAALENMRWNNYSRRHRYIDPFLGDLQLRAALLRERERRLAALECLRGYAGMARAFAAISEIERAKHEAALARIQARLVESEAENAAYKAQLAHLLGADPS